MNSNMFWMEGRSSNSNSLWPVMMSERHDGDHLDEAFCAVFPRVWILRHTEKDMCMINIFNLASAKKKKKLLGYLLVASTTWWYTKRRIWLYTKIVTLMILSGSSHIFIDLLYLPTCLCSLYYCLYLPGLLESFTFYYWHQWMSKDVAIDLDYTYNFVLPFQTMGGTDFWFRSHTSGRLDWQKMEPLTFCNSLYKTWT